MDYKVGSHIPEGKILRRYKDEDGEIFLEVRGIESAYYRVTPDNHVYYKIEKALMENEELNLIDDFSQEGACDGSEAIFELGEFETGEPIMEMEPGMLMKEEYIRSNQGSEADDLEVTELEEGQVTPQYLRPLCKKTGYGGYSLRYHKFLYMLDKDYRVDMKSPDSMADYMMDFEAKIPVIQPVTPLHIEPKKAPGTPLKAEIPVVPLEFDLTVPSINPYEKKTNINLEIKSEYERGDLLPVSLRDRCEEDITTGGGRVIIGNNLYLLDADFVITARMKLTHSEGDAVVPAPAGVSPGQLPIEKIVANVVKHFEMALDKYNINADFFKENVLETDNRETLINSYRGDLTGLNDDTREAASQGKLTVLTGEKGFTLLRAAMLHELYIKSTLTGRGNNMKFLITHIISIEPDGRINESLGNWTLETQRKLLDFFNSRATVYTDKIVLIRQLHRNLYLRNSIFEDYKAIRDVGAKVSFNAFLIAKLYEHTTR
ncbi:MAG TPA: hypothetical protein VK186_07605, partial [Candidatus Deferrimicrobium sp.]|nr:hypothetical protein [Candidatus Deferrimicrobium sp.]